MSLRQDRRSFLRQAIGAAGAGLVVPLLAACTPTAPQPAAAPTTAPAAGSGVTKVSYAYASPNGLHFVATVGQRNSELCCDGPRATVRRVTGNSYLHSALSHHSLAMERARES